MTDQTRAAFEAHFQLTQRQAWQHKDGSYQFPEIQAKWEGYLAGVAASPAIKGEMTDEQIEDFALRFGYVYDDDETQCHFSLSGLRTLIAAVAAAAPGADAWKEAVIEQCIVAEIGWDESDPRKSLQQLITWETQVALDPLVSSEAQALIDRGRNEVAAAAKE